VENTVPVQPAAAPADLAAFLARERRLPRLGDAPAPWRYRGWLLPYVLLLHGLCPAVADRWGYYLRTLEAGRLLDEPIPPIAFGPPDRKVFSLLHDWSRLIGGDCGGWSDFRALLDWLCWGLALGREEPCLAEEVQEKLYRQVNVGPLLERPYDYLGEYVARSKANGWNPTGFYPTPHQVVECMARLAMHDSRVEGRDPRALRVSDPCVGSGRMLLHASNCSLDLRGQDIDPLAVAMCKVNGALYAPWLAFPLPAGILGTQPEPTPAPLPVPEPRPEAVSVFRVHDRARGLLFEW
jgi:N-6 DNA Methylase